MSVEVDVAADVFVFVAVFSTTVVSWPWKRIMTIATPTAKTSATISAILPIDTGVCAPVSALSSSSSFVRVGFFCDAIWL